MFRPVDIYHSGAADITVYVESKRGARTGRWLVTVVTPECTEGARFFFANHGPAENEHNAQRVATWLSERELAGVVRSDMTWPQLYDAVVDRPVQQADEPAQAATDVAQAVLEAHYNDLLADPAQRAALRKMMREAEVLEKAAAIRERARG